MPADTLRKHDPSFAATNPGGASVFFKCIRPSGGERGAEAREAYRLRNILEHARPAPWLALIRILTLTLCRCDEGEGVPYVCYADCRDMAYPLACDLDEACHMHTCCV